MGYFGTHLGVEPSFARRSAATHSELAQSEANPQVHVETPLHPEKLTVWCALWAGGIIGPYFFKNDEGHNVTVNGDRYKAMITNFFIPELNNHDVQELPQTLDHLEDNTRRVIADIRPQMLEKVIENWTSRLDYNRASRGSPMPEIIFKMIEIDNVCEDSRRKQQKSQTLSKNRLEREDREKENAAENKGYKRLHNFWGRNFLSGSGPAPN
ncbi:hypothetical protein TNCV_4214161 [Trichonephila clavipes]|nr:hypothetical protein TNCV_4214161 [Trichonephila clavipes]